MSLPKNSQQSQLGDDEFVLSNSEFMTDEDRSKSKSPIAFKGDRKFINQINNQGGGVNSQSVDEQLKMKMEQELRAK